MISRRLAKRVTTFSLCAGMTVATGTGSGLLAGQQTRPLTLVQQVRAALSDEDFARAEALVANARKEKGDTPENLAALSWLARGAQSDGRTELADKIAAETQTLAVKALNGRSA